jgi:hypothetical protein
MKKFFHLGMIASIVFMMSSCSKSSSDLAANERTAKAGANASMAGLAKLNPVKQHVGPIISSNLSKFFPSINQPFEMPLGDAGSVINSGQIAVFYVLLAPDLMNETPGVATLSTIDELTGNTLETYNLISCKDVETVDAFVPAELVGTTYMVALVHLGDQYVDKMITLKSHIEFSTVYTDAQIARAFSVIQ